MHRCRIRIDIFLDLYTTRKELKFLYRIYIVDEFLLKKSADKELEVSEPK